MGIVKEVLRGLPFHKLVGKPRANNQTPAQQEEFDQKGMLEFYSQFVNEGDLVFDVGANFGNRSKIFLELGADVVAIEPQNECVKSLKDKHGSNQHFTLIQSVLGSEEGEAELNISTENTISSLSEDWIDAVKSSGRFSNSVWDEKQLVSMTTLDRLIESHGTPAFIKVDVEGFEYDVMQGLSQPAKYISLEFVPEFIESTFRCLRHLDSLGNVVFNYSVGESMRLSLDKYVSSCEMIEILDKFVKHDCQNFGDVYCEFHYPKN